MQSKTNQSLQTYARKTLLIRLLLMTLAIVLVVGGIVYLLEQQRVQNEVVEDAKQAVELLVSRAIIIRDEKGIDAYQAFREALAERIAHPIQRQSGEFIYAGFFAPDGEKIDEFIDKRKADNQLVISIFSMSLDDKPQPGTSHAQTRNVDGKDYIYVSFPVLDVQKKVAAYAHAVFALSKHAQQEMQTAIWHSVIAALIIILATSLLLYPVILRLVKRLSGFSADLLDANLQSISLLGGTIAKRDSDTDAHNYRVTIYSVRLAQAMKLDANTIRSLIKGAFLHDVGKIGIRDNILLKPGKLDDDEFTVMKTHVEHGLDIVDRSAWLADAKDVVGGHHEKYAGGGYPHGLKEKEIPISARIFAIADVFDALTSKRPYKEPMSFEKTMAIITEGSQQHFDPELLAVFKKIAAELYKNYCGREDDGLHQELDGILHQYFTTDAKSLLN